MEHAQVEIEVSQLKHAIKSPKRTKMTKIWQVIANKTIFCVPGFRKILLLYTIVPIGVGGHFFHVILFGSKIGLRDQDFQDK